MNFSGARLSAVFGAPLGQSREDGWALVFGGKSGAKEWNFRFERGESALDVVVKDGSEDSPQPHAQRVGSWWMWAKVEGADASKLWDGLRAALSRMDGSARSLGEDPDGRVPSSLSSALDEEDTSEFLEARWGKEPWVAHGDPKRLGELYWEPRLADFQSLCSAHEGPVVASSTANPSRPEEHKIERKNAKKYWDDGWVVTVLEVENTLPIVRRWCSSLQGELTLKQARCGVFSAQPGLGVLKHWDATDLLCIQLRGTKTWRIAPNQKVIHPTANVLPPRHSKELDIYAPGEVFTTTMPSDAREIEMKPGSVLYLPGGWWHTTVDGEGGLSLSFSLERERRFERVLSRLRTHLLQDPQWRAPLEHKDERMSQLLASTQWGNILGAIVLDSDE